VGRGRIKESGGWWVAEFKYDIFDILQEPG
jgi:hypothetical protein